MSGKMSTLDGEMIEILEQTPCPFCFGQFGVSEDVSTKEWQVLHSMPMCEAFLNKNPDDYLSEARSKLVGGTSSEDMN
jgi:hypothetical protein